MKNPTIHRDTCGTEKGYRAHQRNKEERCQPCRTAWNNRCKKYTPEPPPKAAEVIEEIEWLLKAHQGTHYILKAIGYTGREHSLKSRLEKHRRPDLARRLLNMEDQAA